MAGIKLANSFFERRHPVAGGANLFPATNSRLGGGDLTKPVGDARFGEIVRRHLQAHAVPDRQPHKMAPHLAGDVRQHLMLVVQHDAKHRSGQNGLNRSFQFNGLFGARSVCI